MISRRDKLLVQPWEDRRYEDHRRKVQTAVAAVDTRAPPARPHVALKLKKLQRESERSSRIQNDNFSLLQRLGALMSTNWLDNHWTRPLPRFQHKVRQFCGAPAAPPPPRADTPPAGKSCACAHLKRLAM